MNPNWPRWIKASVAKHFNDVATANTLQMFIEGTDRDPNPPDQFAEFRLDGPFIRQVNPHYWILDIQVNLLLQGTINDRDIYNIERIVGFMLSGFTEDIKVFKLGTGEQDDQTQLGCLIQRSDNKQDVYIANFGQKQPGVRLCQSAITAGYRMQLDDEN